MKFALLKLGTECRDKATGLKGTLTHWIMNMGQRVEYVFQPRGLNEDGQPVTKLALCLERLDVDGEDFETVEVPFEILGTQVTDKATGFTGMAIAFVRHINGCFHVEIQPAGTLPKKGTAISAYEFDIRGCVGDKIPKLAVAEKAQSQMKEPSPAQLPARRSYGTEPISTMASRRR